MTESKEISFIQDHKFLGFIRVCLSPRWHQPFILYLGLGFDYVLKSHRRGYVILEYGAVRYRGFLWLMQTNLGMTHS